MGLDDLLSEAKNKFLKQVDSLVSKAPNEDKDELKYKLKKSLGYGLEIARKSHQAIGVFLEKDPDFNEISNAFVALSHEYLMHLTKKTSSVNEREKRELERIYDDLDDIAVRISNYSRKHR